jgi:hypothetical protein
MGKGGGGQPTQTNSNVTNTNVPEYARPYVENMLGATQQQLFKMDGNNITGFQPYKAYGGTYDEAGNQTAYDPSKAIAGFSPMQQQAQRGIGNMQLPGEFGTAASSTQQAMQQALGANYAPSNYGSQFNPQGIGYDAQTMQGYQMGPAERVSTQSFAEPGSASAYMSPYMQNVVEIQKREAQRQSGIQGTQQQAQATQAGAFGGSRDAIMRAERERNLGQQMGDIQAQGSQAAFQQAQQQFNAEQQARLSAQQANQQAGITVGQQNLGAAQQTGLANQAALNQAGQFNAGQNLQAASLGAQYGQAANQLNEQSRQYGAGYGLQGLQAGMQGASQLANIGNQGLQAQQGIYGLQNQMGQQQQQNQQQIINQAMQDYANAQQYPLMQLGTMSNMLRGLPMQAQTTQQYQAQANPITQGIGAIGALGSLSQMKAKGGAVKSMAKGGITSIPRYDVGGAVLSQLAQKNDEELAKEARESPSPRVREMAAAILKQRQAGMNAEPQASEAPQGVGPMGVDYNAGYAGGGIIAFARGREVPFIASANDANAGEAEAKKAMASGIVPAAVTPVVPVPANDANAGEAEAKQAMAKGVVPASAPAGILAAPPVETDPGRAAIADAKKAMEPFTTIANKTTKQLYEDELADRKALGLDNSEAKQKLMQQQMAERANLVAENERTNLLRRAKFFAELGSTPGNTLVAGLVALKNQIPDILQDAKDQKLARQQADKAIFDLEESMRMEKLGVYDKADVKKQSAIKTMADLQASLTTASVQQASSEKRLQADLAQSAATLAASTARDATDIKQAEIMERSARTVAEIKAISDAAQTRQVAAQRAESAAVAADQKLFTQHAAAQQELSRAMERAERLRSGKDYQASLAVIQQATIGVPLKPDGTVDESKINSVLKANYDRAKANIERADTEMFNMVKAADETAKIAFNRLNIPGGAGAPPANNIRAAVEAGGQKYEPDKYDYKIAEDGSVQRKSKGR